MFEISMARMQLAHVCFWLFVHQGSNDGFVSTPQSPPSDPLTHNHSHRSSSRLDNRKLSCADRLEVVLSTHDYSRWSQYLCCHLLHGRNLFTVRPHPFINIIIVFRLADTLWKNFCLMQCRSEVGRVWRNYQTCPDITAKDESLNGGERYYLEDFHSK